MAQAHHIDTSPERLTALRKKSDTDGTKDPHPGFPRGWFVIAFSDELKPGQVEPLHYFDQDLVLFRTETGQAKVMDAFCPHLGAHLGYGGKVEGEGIRCPFHAWRFNGEGSATTCPTPSAFPRRRKSTAGRSWRRTE